MNKQEIKHKQEMNKNQRVFSDQQKAVSSCGKGAANAGEW